MLKYAKRYEFLVGFGSGNERYDFLADLYPAEGPGALPSWSAAVSGTKSKH